jgi:hypothetical protein
MKYWEIIADQQSRLKLGLRYKTSNSGDDETTTYYYDDTTAPHPAISHRDWACDSRLRQLQTCTANGSE